MSEIDPRRRKPNPTVQALLAVFNEETATKLRVAPVDSLPLFLRSDGSVCEVDVDGWLVEYDSRERRPSL
ncbi:hypothetical protein [Nocardia anaemiae]|uniref:hypothetical protein n=1 Tax=Nocardia anaemiae TaxID=263910 RepID=UPI000AC985CE|nr:hypothetical protein [Nocardia anaemiae]